MANGQKRKPPKPPERWTIAKEEKILKLIAEKGLAPSVAAQAVGLARSTLYNHVQSSKDFKRRYKEALRQRDQLLCDQAEHIIHESMLRKNVKVAQWILERNKASRYRAGLLDMEGVAKIRITLTASKEEEQTDNDD